MAVFLIACYHTAPLQVTETLLLYAHQASVINPWAQHLYDDPREALLALLRLSRNATQASFQFSPCSGMLATPEMIVDAAWQRWSPAAPAKLQQKCSDLTSCGVAVASWHIYQPNAHAKLAHHPVLALQAAQYTTGNTAKATKLQGAEQNTKVHVTTHLQAACWAAGFENETVMNAACAVCSAALMLERQLLLQWHCLQQTIWSLHHLLCFSQTCAEAVCRLRQQTNPHLSRCSPGDVEEACHL